MGFSQNKLLFSLHGKTILEQTLYQLEQVACVAHFYVAVAAEDWDVLQRLFGDRANITLVLGGKERQDSVANALKVVVPLLPGPFWVLVHDGARPLCSVALVERVIEECRRSGAAVPLVPVTDTIREKDNISFRLLDRSRLYATQTPQGAEFKIISAAYHHAESQDWRATDDASLIERWGHSVTAVEGDVQNIKVTTPHDLKFAEWLLKETVYALH